jgi:sugar lactone lactonase YvrE
VSNAGGPSEVLAEDQGGPRGIATDGQSLYWANSGSGTVMRVSVDGGTAVVLATSQQEPWSVAVDGESVYWTNHAGGTVMKTAK